MVHKFFHNYKNVFIDMLIKSASVNDNNIEIKKTFCDKLSRLLKAEIANGTLRYFMNRSAISRTVQKCPAILNTLSKPLMTFLIIRGKRGSAIYKYPPAFNILAASRANPS